MEQEAGDSELPIELRYTCRSCKGKKARRKWRYLQLPAVLTIQLKLFLNSQSKITHVVPFPQRMDLRDFCLPNLGEDAEYELNSIVAHGGDTIHSGHYIALVRTEKTWYAVNDVNVKSVSDDRVGEYFKGRNESGNTTPYLLFYSRCR